ncbi:hypothetical protein PZA18_24835, partial [Chitinimonas sp. DQS-5]|nr:hypothetical protein [Parachitinimonas caeni]
NPDTTQSPAYTNLPDEAAFGTVWAGVAGNQNLIGSSDADLLDGGAGNDTLDGGAGNDALLGGFGNDVYQFNTGSGIDTVIEQDA